MCIPLFDSVDAGTSSRPDPPPDLDGGEVDQARSAERDQPDVSPTIGSSAPRSLSAGEGE
jgi:hypothetical protein